MDSGKPRKLTADREELKAMNLLMRCQMAVDFIDDVLPDVNLSNQPEKPAGRAFGKSGVRHARQASRALGSTLSLSIAHAINEQAETF